MSFFAFPVPCKDSLKIDKDTCRMALSYDELRQSP